MVADNFKVIVVGGGPTGLTAAHALSRAGIDYVALEHRYSVVIDVGASLVLWPQGLRVLAQLGLLERLQEIGADLRHSITMTLDAHKYKENWVTEVMERNHGTYPIIFHRAHLLDVLYESLSKADKARILTSKKVTDITTTQRGVEVRCGDGSTYHGSIIIGADGAHSMVRQRMRELAIQSSASEVNEESPFLSEYRALWCNFPRQPSLESGSTFEIHGKDVSLQCLVGDDRAWLFIYEHLENPTRDRISYSKDDVEALAARRADLAVSDHLKVRDIFPKRYAAGMTNLEEGILKHWSWNRIVLVGDACHKFTPNQGLGYNNGIQDVVALANELHSIKPVDNSSGASVSLDALTGAFSRYQAARVPVIQKDLSSSAGLTRMSTWCTWMLHLLDRYILPSIPRFDDLMLHLFTSRIVSKCLILDFVESDEPFQGKVPWKNVMKSPSIKLSS